MTNSLLTKSGIEAFDGKVRYLVLIGQTREKIEGNCSQVWFYEYDPGGQSEEAVKICAEKANKGDAVLFITGNVQAGDSWIITNSVAGCSKNMYIRPAGGRCVTRAEGMEPSGGRGGTVQEVLRRQAGFHEKRDQPCKFLPDGIRKHGIRCRVTEKKRCR